MKSGKNIAIGGSITLSYGTTNALIAILVASIAIMLVGVPISRYATRHGVDVDLLTRGASFGYIGSTITSLIYASFTFILTDGTEWDSQNKIL